MTPRPVLLLASAALVMVVAALASAPQVAFAQPPKQVDCDLGLEVFAVDAVDEVPLDPVCAARRLGSTLMSYPATFFRQHALCPDDTVKSSPTGAPQSLIIDYFSDEDFDGTTGEGTSYVISGAGAAKQSIKAYTLGSQIVNDPVPAALDVTAFMSFAVNTSEFNAPLMFSDAKQDATVVWNYDADQKTGQILNVNVAIFTPGAGANAEAVEAAARKSKINGACVEAFGPSNFTPTAEGVEYFGVEDFATGRLMLFAQLQKGNCSVDSVVHLNPKPMQTGCGLPPPPSPKVARKLFLECGGELGLPFVIDAIKDVLKTSANQTVPSKEDNIAASNDMAASNVNSSSSTLQTLRQRGSAIVSSAVGAIQDVSGSFQYDGANNWALNFSLALGDIPGPTNLTAFQLLKRILDKCSPFLDVQLNKGAISNPLTTATFSYSSSTQLLDIKFTTKQAMWLLTAAAKDVGSLVGFSVPDPPAVGDDTPTLITRVVTDRVNGLRLLSIGLDGAWTIGSLARRIGINWPFSDDVVSISNPSVIFVAPPSFQMEDGTVLPSSLRVNLLLTVPGIGLQNAVAGLVVQGSSTFFFSIYGSCTPIPSWPDFVAVGFAFSITNTSGITATFQAQLYEMDIAATLNYDKGVLTASLTATNVAIVTIIKNIFSDVKIPGILLDLISPLKFSDVSLTATYDSKKTTKKLTFQFVAVPNIEKTSAFGNALSKLGLDPNDVTLSFKPDNSGQNTLAFGVSKSVKVPLPSPFLGPGTCVFSVQAQTNPPAVQIYGSFSAAMTLKGADSPLNFSVGAGVLVGPGVPQLLLDAALTSPFSITKFPWIKLNSLSLSAAIEINPSAPILRKLVITGSQVILGSTATEVILYNTNVQPPVFAMQVTIANFDLQSALNQMGIRASLGSFNLVIRSASFSFAPEDVVVNGISIPAGTSVAGSISLFSMLDADVRLVMQPVGTSFSVAVNSTVLAQAFTKYVLAPLTDTLKAASSACQTASNAVGRTAAEADASFKKASDAVAAAQKEANDKLAAWLAYQKDVNAAFQAAQTKMNDALNVFNQAKKKVDDAAAAAQSAFDSALAKFNALQDRVNSEFRTAQSKVDAAQRTFDSWYNDRKAELDSKERDLNGLRDKVNKFNDNSCFCVNPCFWGSCRKCFSCNPQYAWAVPALATAELALSGIRAILNGVNTATQKVALDGARRLLDGAQSAVNSLANSAEAVARVAAEKALQLAKNAANAVLTGTEAVARNAATAALNAAQATANGVLQSTHYLASTAANAALQAAQSVLSSAKAVADKALSVVKAALDDLSSALNKLATPGFFQLNGFSVAVEALATSTKASASLQVTLGSTQFNPSISLDLGNPLESIKNVVKTEGVAAVKKLFPGALAALG